MSRAYRERQISPLLWCIAGVAFLYLVIPVCIIVPLSFSSSRFLSFPPPGWSLEWYRTFFNDPVWINSTINSFKFGIVVALIATPIGTTAAYGLIRTNFPAKKLISAFLLSPMIVPVVVTAISLYGFYARIGIVGGFWGIVAAHTLLAIPLVIINVAASLQRFDSIFETASLSLGANPILTFLRVTLPNIRAGVLSGALLAFITSFDELVIVMFVGGSTMTLPRKIWDDLVVLIEPTQAAASVVIIGVSVLALVMWALLQKRM